MQPSNPFLTFGVSAVVAASALAASPAAAESGLPRRPTAVNKPDLAEAVSNQSDGQPTGETQTIETQTAQTQTIPPVGQNPQNRLDQLQTESQIQQQIQQAEFRSYNRSLTGGTNTMPNALQLDQQVQQQLDLQNAQQLRRNVGTSPSTALDQLQFEQRVRQQIQQQNQPHSEATVQQSTPPSSTRVGTGVSPQASKAAASHTATAHPPTPNSSAQNSSSSTNGRARSTVAQTNGAQTTVAQVTGVQPATQPAAASSASSPQTSAAASRLTRILQGLRNSHAASSRTPNRSSTAANQSTNQSTAKKPPSNQPATANASATAGRASSSGSLGLDTLLSDRFGLSVLGAGDSGAGSSGVSTLGAGSPKATSSNAAASGPTTAPSSSRTSSAPAARTDRNRKVETAQSTPQPTPGPTQPTQTTPATGSPASTPAPGSPATGSPTTGSPATGSPTLSVPFNSTPTTIPSNLSIPNPIVPPSAPPSNADLTNNNPAPDYLNPDPNPLSFPTQTNEVDVVGTQPITLKQAVELALRNNPALEQERLTLGGTQASLRNAEATNYPTLSNTTNFSYTGGETATVAPSTLSNGVTTIPNPNAGRITRTFSDATSLGTGLQLSYNVFTSGRRPALIRAAQGQVRLQQLEVERQTEQLILTVTNDYYNLQQASAQVNIFNANLAQAQQSLRDAQALERAGVGTRFDVLQAQVEVSNAQQQLTQQLSQLDIARRTLAQQLNISQEADITTADPIEVAGVWDLSLGESIVQAYKNRVELEQQLIQREVAQQNRRAALAQLGPQVALNTTFQVTTPEVNFDRIGYNYQVGVAVDTNLFDGGAARAQADQQESNIAIAESQFEQTRNQIRFDIEQAYSQLNASFANIQTTALGVTQATEALRLARLRFQAGVGTQTDVLQQQTALAQAQVNNLTAVLDYNRALATLRRAVSNYPEGFLNQQP